MTSSSECITFLAEAGKVHLPTLRFALRAVVATKTYGEHIYDDARLLRLLGPALVLPEPMRIALSARFAKEVESHPAASYDALSLCKLFLSHEFAVWPEYRAQVLTTWHLEPDLIMQAFSETLAVLDSDALRHLGQHENLAHVSELYGLDSLQTEILQYAATSQQWPGFRNFLKYLQLPSMGAAWGLFSTMIGCTESELRKVLKSDGKLRTSKLIKLDYAPDHMGEFVNVGPVSHRLFLLRADSRDELQSCLLDPVCPPLLTIADFPHLSEEFDLIVDCLKTAAHTRETGINILIQGPTGVGKTQLARLLVQATGLSGFDIEASTNNSFLNDDSDKRLQHFEWTQRILQTHPGAIVIFEGFGPETEQCELLLKQRLDTCTVPTLWTIDDSKALDDSILRRFVFHLKLHQRPLSARRQLVSQVIPDFVVDPGKLDAIATQHSLSPAQLVMAARFARLAAWDKPATKTKALLCAVDASQRITDRTPTGLPQSADRSHWDLETLNLEASAPLHRILDGLRRTGCASLAFHGIPGTGKSSLAAYIANTLDRPLLTKRVSDLSSKWIGETEKAIANMFHEAAADGSILLLDEADSFLRDRRLARSSWEVTQVNELLQQMENFKGVFICATNLVRNMDAAAMRRFTFKIKFLPLDDMHRRRMLATYALSDPQAELPQRIGDRLAALTQLAPGDFASVRRQEVLINEHFSLESWIAELEREHAVREPAAKRRAAFV